MTKFYDFLLTVLTPFIIMWGKLHWPFTHKKITGEHYYNLRDQIEVGTVILTKTNGEFSNIINPTDIKHSGIYVGNMGFGNVCYVLESTGKGAILTDLVTFLTSKDIIVVCKPKFIRTNVNEFQYMVHEFARIVKGAPYDYLFNKDGKAYYCFELSASCLKHVYSELNLKCREILKGKKIYDENTFMDSQFFEIIFDSRNEK